MRINLKGEADIRTHGTMLNKGFRVIHIAQWRQKAMGGSISLKPCGFFRDLDKDQPFQ
jgi:hypothetical protein